LQRRQLATAAPSVDKEGAVLLATLAGVGARQLQQLGRSSPGPLWMLRGTRCRFCVAANVVAVAFVLAARQGQKGRQEDRVRKKEGGEREESWDGERDGEREGVKEGGKEQSS